MKETIIIFLACLALIALGVIPTYTYMNHIYAKEIRAAAIKNAYISGQISICGPAIKDLIEKGAVNIINGSEYDRH
jgi:hypothetical protein